MAKGIRASGKGKKAKAKACAAPSSRGQTPRQQALQKIRENLGSLPEFCRMVKVAPGTGQTLAERLEADMLARRQGAAITIGKSYYRDRLHEYAPEDSCFAMLKPVAGDESVVSPACLKACH